MNDFFEHQVIIAAPRERVWAELTEPERMARWMGEPEMNLRVSVEWAEGAWIEISGFHHVKFVNRGTVLHVDPPKQLRYTHLSSVSRLKDAPENHSTYDFRLDPEGEGTRLSLRVTGFPTESIYKHLEFYWRGTLSIIKRVSERGPETAAGTLGPPKTP